MIIRCIFIKVEPCEEKLKNTSKKLAPKAALLKSDGHEYAKMQCDMWRQSRKYHEHPWTNGIKSSDTKTYTVSLNASKRQMGTELLGEEGQRGATGNPGSHLRSFKSKKKKRTPSKTEKLQSTYRKGPTKLRVCRLRQLIKQVTTWHVHQEGPLQKKRCSAPLRLVQCGFT